MNVKKDLPGEVLFAIRLDGARVEVDVSSRAVANLLVALVQALEESPEARRGLRSVAGLPPEGGEK